MKKHRLLIKNAKVIDPANKCKGIFDILIEEEKISKVAKEITEKQAKVIDATNKIVMPALVDMHVHLRQPGREDKETIASGTQAALKGGITAVLAMPNTQPPIDSIERIESLKDIIEKEAAADVLIAGAITKARSGEKLTDIEAFKEKSVLAITDDGSSVDSDELMEEALIQAKNADILVICHCEDKALSKEGVVNLGFTSTKLGLKGISKESEYKRVKRDIELAKKTGARIHIAHVSCRESVELIEKAKKDGVLVTAETAPHYFTLSEEAVSGFDTNKKMNPPLRSKDDIEAIKQGLKSGAIDVIASDHAPHTENEKDIEFDRAEFGVVGLETELAVSITELVLPGVLSMEELVKKISLNPAKILKIDKGTLREGAQADVVIVSSDKEWVVEKEDIISKSKNSCFLGKRLKGVVDHTIYKGQIVWPRE
jgi:dihydroorotase